MDMARSMFAEFKSPYNFWYFLEVDASLEQSGYLFGYSSQNR
jgi:hypothetical protein